MRKMTIDDLCRILIEYAGEDDVADFSADISDRSFAELGYDSLALIEMATRIRQEFGVTIPDYQISERQTPREVFDVVNNTVAQTA